MSKDPHTIKIQIDTKFMGLTDCQERYFRR